VCELKKNSILKELWKGVNPIRAASFFFFNGGQWRLHAIAVGPPGPTGFDETSRILL
jgi:hypothetical protein